MVHGNTIVTQCIADCVSGGACEMGISTHRDHRRRGLGTITAAASVEYCLNRELLSIGWHCIANNRGSQRVAENVGFVLGGEYMQYSNRSAAENADDLTSAEWQSHADFFERASENMRRQSAVMAWRAAEARAVAGEHARALALLQHAADSGELPPGWDSWLQESWAFQSLRSDPDWPALLDRAKSTPR
jgi:hypothetical protein